LDISIMAYGPMAHGLLTGAVTAETVFEPTDWRAAGDIFCQPLLTPDNAPRNLAVVGQLKEVARDLGTTLPQMALAWVMRHPQVGVALTGVRTQREIEDNVAALEIQFADATLRDIETVMAGAIGQTDQVPT
jgi:aryl-alcohol dehydrogenase-like predicted oxidoreductase